MFLRHRTAWFNCCCLHHARPPLNFLYSEMRNYCVWLRPISSRRPRQNAHINLHMKTSKAWRAGGRKPADTQSCCRRGTDIPVLEWSSLLCKRAVEPSLDPLARSPVTMHVAVSCSRGAPQYAQQHLVLEMCDLTDFLILTGSHMKSSLGISSHLLHPKRIVRAAQVPALPATGSTEPTRVHLLSQASSALLV